MSTDDPINAYLIDTQIKLFDDAKHDLQLTSEKIAEKAGVSKSAVDAWACGRNGLSLWAIKKLLRVPGFSPYLSRLFAPEDYALVGTSCEEDHAAYAEKCIDFTGRYMAARHPKSEAGVEIGPTENRDLRQARASA